MRRLRIEHVTEYHYSVAVSLSTHRLLLRPRDSYQIRVAAASLEIRPAHNIRYRRDPLDNAVALVDFLEATRELCIASNLLVEHYADSPLDFVVELRGTLPIRLSRGSVQQPPLTTRGSTINRAHQRSKRRMTS